MLWHFAGEFSPRGDIGRVSDEDIADGVMWDKDANALIHGLLKTRWLDSSGCHRLIIHDWPDHADDAVVKKLGRMGDDFLPEYPRRRDAVARRSREHPLLTPDAVVHTRAEGQGKAWQGKEFEQDKNGGVPLCDRYRDFVEQWPENNRRGVDLGAQVWASFVDSGEINEENVSSVFEGLARHKTSEQWLKEGGKFIPSIASGSKAGWLQQRAWKDCPKQAEVDAWGATN